jgi:hypothetical protein
LPKLVQSAEGGKGNDQRERIIVVVRTPCQENYPEDAHTGAHKSVLGSANPAWTWSVHLDAPGQRHGQKLVSRTADPGVVKQDKSSRGSVDTTKTRSDPQRVRMCSGERPIGAAKGKQPDTEALCQTPTPPRAAVSVVTSGNPHRSQALQRRSLSCGLVAWPRPLASCLRLCTFARVSPTHRIAAAVRTARAATACG